MNKLLTVRELSKILGVHEVTLYKLSASRRIPSIKLPGCGVRFREREVLNWISENERKGIEIL